MVTVPQTCECQEAIAAANTHGKRVFATGGEHETFDNMFKAAEIYRQTVEAKEREKDKKSQVEYHRRPEAALPILDCQKEELKNNVGRLTNMELEALLWCKGVPVLKMFTIRLSSKH
jgi:hypothetical protein